MSFTAFIGRLGGSGELWKLAYSTLEDAVAYLTSIDPAYTTKWVENDKGEVVFGERPKLYRAAVFHRDALHPRAELTEHGYRDVYKSVVQKGRWLTRQSMAEDLYGLCMFNGNAAWVEDNEGKVINGNRPDDLIWGSY